MKQNTTELENPRRRVVRKNKQRELTIGVDLGDKTSRYCVLDREGNVLFERSTATTKKGLAQAVFVEVDGWPPFLVDAVGNVMGRGMPRPLGYVQEISENGSGEDLLAKVLADEPLSSF
jgi:hypothetical protein